MFNRFGVAVLGVLAVIGIILFFNYAHFSGVSQASQSPLIKPRASIPLAVPRAKILPRVVVAEVKNLSPNCASLTRAVANLDTDGLFLAARKAYHSGKPENFAEFLLKVDDFREKDKCEGIDKTNLIAPAQLVYAKVCARVKDLANPKSPDQLKSIFDCMDALNAFQFAVVEAAYRGRPIEKIDDPGALTVLMKGTMRRKSDDRSDKIYAYAHQLGKVEPNNVQAAEVEMQASYGKMIMGGANDKPKFEAALERLEGLDRSSPRVQEAKLNLIAQRGDASKLVELAAELKANRPDNDLGSVYSAMGDYMQGNKNAAISELEQFAKLHPNNFRVTASLNVLKQGPPGLKPAEVFIDKNLLIFPEQFDEENESGEVIWQQPDK